MIIHLHCENFYYLNFESFVFWFPLYLICLPLPANFRNLIFAVVKHWNLTLFTLLTESNLFHVLYAFNLVVRVESPVCKTFKVFRRHKVAGNRLESQARSNDKPMPNNRATTAVADWRGGWNIWRSRRSSEYAGQWLSNRGYSSCWQHSP